MKKYDAGEQITMFDLGMDVGKMCQVPSAAATPNARTFASSSRNSSALVTAPYLCLDLRMGAGNLLGPCWENDAPWLGGYTTLNTGPAPHSGAAGFTLSQILQDSPPTKYYLSSTACLGILRRAKERGKSLPPVLKAALEIQSTIDIRGFVLPDTDGRETIVFACNQRDEVRDLHDVAGALCANQTMKQQTFVLNPWDTQQARISVPDGVAPSLCGADGGGGRNPAGLILAQGVVSKGDGDVFLTDEVHTALTSGGGQAGQGYPCVLTAGFCAGAGSKAQGIGYQEEISPTIKSGGGNGMPSVICLNDQGGQVMQVSDDVCGTLRAQEHGHQPLVYSIAGNAIDRQPHNGGNGLGYQVNISYTLTSCDRHSVYSQQRSDEYIENTVASTQSARQYKDATDVVIMPTNFIRRLTPLECERLQGFPDFWTDIPGASDSARYKALGNSVAIPCVEHVLRGVAFFLRDGDAGA